MCGTSTIGVWVEEIQVSFPHLRVIQWVGSGTKITGSVGGTTLSGGATALEAFVDQQDILDPQTGQILIVTSFSTVVARLLDETVTLSGGTLLPKKLINNPR